MAGHMGPLTVRSHDQSLHHLVAHIVREATIRVSHK